MFKPTLEKIVQRAQRMYACDASGTSQGKHVKFVVKIDDPDYVLADEIIKGEDG